MRRRQRNGAGRCGDRHADRRRPRRCCVGDRVGEAAGSAEARGGGVGDRVVAVDGRAPPTTLDTAVTVRGSLSGSLSLPSTAMLTAVPAAVVAGIGNRDRSAISGRLAFEGGGDVDVANAMGVGQ